MSGNKGERINWFQGAGVDPGAYKLTQLLIDGYHKDLQESLKTGFGVPVQLIFA